MVLEVIRDSSGDRNRYDDCDGGERYSQSGDSAFAAFACRNAGYVDRAGSASLKCNKNINKL